tara:strand:- start:1001 stop:1273 length:273 start_codon:yes stop_codon:yes gene_type:complete
MKSDTILSVLMWGLPIVFASGALYRSVTATADAIEIAEISLEEHENLSGHPITEIRIEKIQEDQQEMMEEQKKIMLNVSAICQATGADCR